ncbi:MAG: cupin domain-containing protein [Planctomycetota bacterium]
MNPHPHDRRPRAALELPRDPNDWTRPHDVVDVALRVASESHLRGELRAEDVARYQRHLESCDVCRELLGDENAVDAVLSRALARNAAAGAGDELWERIAERMGADEPTAQPWRAWLDSGARTRSDGFSVSFERDAEFEPTSHPGVRTRRLAVDPSARQVTMLVEMQPGSSYPPHRHGGPEECFVLSGDLQVGDDLEMRTGDFQRAEKGSIHPVQSTRGGCLLLIVSSVDDELLAG